MVLGDCLLNVFTIYAPHSGKPDEEKESLGDDVFHLVSCMTLMTLSVKMKFFEWQSRWLKKDRI